jgi:hypothetical protein
MNNNINTLTFENHDTYIYYINEFVKSDQIVNLTPTNPENTDKVIYLSSETNLFTNGVNNGVIKFNSFNRFNLNDNITIGTSIITIVTNDGILMGNWASERNSSSISASGIQRKFLATYKSGKYANYINVEIQVVFEDTYRIVTISY